MAKQKGTEKDKTVTKRTEEEKVFQSPLEVTLGGKTYPIRPLVIKESREWRKKISELLGSLPKYAKVNTDQPEEFEAAISLLVASMPDAIIDLFFDYAKDLDRKKIEGEATEVELAEGFEGVLSMAFPLTASLGKAMEKLGQ